MEFLKKSSLYTFLLIFSSISFCNGQMTNQKMDEIFKKEATQVEGNLGGWQMLYGEQLIVVITDENANRMRIFTPVLEEEKVESKELKKMLEANFHSALDAKYCIYNGFVISVFTHPLQELTEIQLIDAMRQVVTLSNNYGTTYSSTGWIFGGGFEKEEPRINQSPSGGKKN